MRTSTIVIALTVLLAASAAARASTSRKERLVKHHTERARTLMSAAARTDSSAASLRHLERATRHLERAYRFDRAAARSELTSALNGITRIHLDRRALKRAERFNARALEVHPGDGLARRLGAMIRIERGIDLENQFTGATSLRRLEERRAEQGLPYRPRGIGRRR
jgi:hypothetical protein